MFERKPVVPRERKVEVVPATIYSLDEIRETVKKDSAEVKWKAKAEQDELDMMKALQANIARNRIRITREFLSVESGLSLQRKLAM